jgi:hypothetical protein
MAHAACASSTGEYQISIDTSADPGLTLTTDDKLLSDDVRVQITGSASL